MSVNGFSLFCISPVLVLSKVHPRSRLKSDGNGSGFLKAQSISGMDNKWIVSCDISIRCVRLNWAKKKKKRSHSE